MHLSLPGWLFLFAAILLAPHCASAKDPVWRKLQSEHFELYTPDSEKTGRQVLQHLERIRGAYEFLTKSKIQKNKRGRIVLFQNEKEYEQYRAGQFSAAYYMKARGEDYVVLSDFTPDIKRILNHEYFHLFSAHAEFNLPVWLEEGLADFFSTLEISSKNLSYGYPIENHLMYLNSLRGHPIPLARVFAINRENRYSNNREMTSQLYAQGWALTHMTFLGPNMMTRSSDFFKQVRGQESAVDAYQSVYGASPVDLDQLMRSYIRQAAYTYLKVPVEGLDITAEVTPAAIEDWEAPLILADLLTYSRRRDAAEQRYDELSKRFPTVPEIDESRGYLARLEMDRDKVTQFYRAAAEKGSKSSHLYVELVASTCQISTSDEDCMKWIAEAIRLDQTNKQARKWAIANALNTRRFEHALVYLARWGTVSPEDAPMFFEQYAYAQSNMGKPDEAKAAIKRGLQFARKPEEISRLHTMERHIVAGETYEKQMAEFRAAVQEDTQEGPPPDSGPENVDPTRPRNRPISDNEREIELIKEAAHNHAATAEAHFTNFLALGNTVVSSATMKNMDCREGAPRLQVMVEGKPVLLAIDDPGQIRVFVKGQNTTEYEFTCGTQKASPVMVGYKKEGAPQGTEGVVRILSFP